MEFSFGSRLKHGMDEFGSRLKHGWNAFSTNRDPTYYRKDIGASYSYRPDRPRFTRGNEKSIVNAIYNRIALDVAAINIQHVQLDEEGRYMYSLKTGLNNCLTVEANVDQTSRAFIQDVVMSMFDEGCVAIVPIDTTLDPNKTGSYDIDTMRVGKILDWYPRHVKVHVYNDRTGEYEDIIMSKTSVAIIENPLYSVINEPNSTMKRLIRKLNLLDAVDEQSSSGKLDLIIQLPYVVKTEARRQQAENRRKDIERQLSGSKYGIAYTDGTERITQLNRSVENNLLKQIEYLTSMLYSQLGISQGILDGSADEQTMLKYDNRTVEPIVSAIVDAMKRTFLTKTARSQMKSIKYFRDPFKLVPLSEIAEIADKFTRNEILSSNEIRQIIGMKPSSDPKADELRNSNLNHPEEAAAVAPANEIPEEEVSEQEISEEGEEANRPMTQEEFDQAMKDLDDLDAELDSLELELDDELKHYASPYYDPVKAHEYYERTKELRKRKSTSGLNDEGKAAAKYVREQLTTERKAKVQTHKDQTNSQIDSLRETRKSTVAAHKEAMQGKIDNLRARLKGMSKLQKERAKDRIYAEIDTLRAENKQERERLMAEFKEASGQLRTEHKEERSRLKTEYDEKYISELDKIKADDKFKKSSKKKKG